MPSVFKLFYIISQFKKFVNKCMIISFENVYLFLPFLF